MSQFAKQLKKTLQAARARKKVQGTEIPPVTRVIFLRPVAHPCASSVDLLYVIEPHESYDPDREPRKPIIFVWDLCSDLDGARIPSTGTTRRHVFDHETGQYKDIGLHTAIYPGFVSQLVVPVDSDVTADTSAKPGIDERIGDADYLEFLLSHPERFYIKEYVGSVQQRTLSLLRMGAVVMIGDDVTHSSHDDMDSELLTSDKKDRKSVKRSRDSLEVESESNSAPMTFISLDPENKKHRGDKTIGMMHVDTLVGGVPLPLAPMMMTRTWLEESGAKQIAEELVQVCLSVTARNFRTQTCMTNALQYYYDQLFSACDLYTGRKDEENKIKEAVLTLWVYKTNQLYNLTHGKYYKYLLRFSNTSVTWTNQQIQRVNDERQQVIRQRKRPRAKAGASKESSTARLTVSFERGPGENEAYDAWHERQDKIRQRNLLESIQKNQPEVVGRGLGGIVCRYPYQIKSSPRTPQWAIDFFESLQNVEPPLAVPDELYHYGMVFSDPNDINTVLQEIAEEEEEEEEEEVSDDEDEEEDEGLKRMEEVD